MGVPSDVLDTALLYTNAIAAFKCAANRHRAFGPSVDAATRWLRRYAHALVDHLEDRIAHDHVPVTDPRRLRQLELAGVANAGAARLPGLCTQRYSIEGLKL